MDIVSSINNNGKQIFDNSVNESMTPTNISLGEIIEDESHQVATVVIFVITAVIFIILIFVSAVFIDCRQQKIEDSKIKRLKRGARRRLQNALPSLPTIRESSHRDDEDTIVGKMEPTSSSATIV